MLTKFGRVQIQKFVCYKWRKFQNGGRKNWFIRYLRQLSVEFKSEIILERAFHLLIDSFKSIYFQYWMDFKHKVSYLLSECLIEPTFKYWHFLNIIILHCLTKNEERGIVCLSTLLTWRIFQKNSSPKEYCTFVDKESGKTSKVFPDFELGHLYNFLTQFVGFHKNTHRSNKIKFSVSIFSNVKNCHSHRVI